MSVKALSVEEEERQKENLAQTPHALPWMVDVVSASLPYLADKATIKKTLEEFKGNINSAVDKLLGAEENGSQSSAQESSSVEREPDSDEEYQHGPSKKRISNRHKSTKAESPHTLSKLAARNGSRDSFSSEQSQQTDASSVVYVKAETSPDSVTVKSESSQDKPRPTIRIKLKPPAPPSTASSGSTGRTQQKQQGPQRQNAREKKDIKKQAQKAARKERQQAAIKAGTEEAPAKSGITLRTKSVTNPPPIESGFRTLFI